MGLVVWPGAFVRQNGKGTTTGTLRVTAPHSTETRQDIYSATAAYEGNITAALKLRNDVRVRCIQGCI